MNNYDFTKEELVMLFTSLQAVIKLSPLLDWEELEPKLKDYRVNLYETMYGHFLNDRQPSTLDKEVFAKTLSKVFKKMGAFMDDEEDIWNHSMEQFKTFLSQQTREITEEEDIWNHSMEQFKTFLSQQTREITEEEAVSELNNLRKKWIQ